MKKHPTNTALKAAIAALKAEQRARIISASNARKLPSAGEIAHIAVLETEGFSLAIFRDSPRRER